MKTHIAAWMAAIFMGAAFVAMPTLDSQDEYLQPTQTETAAERALHAFTLRRWLQQRRHGARPYRRASRPCLV